MSSPARAAEEKRPTLLLVEDDSRLSDLISRYLAQNGFDVRSIARGADALACIERTPPDLLILDLNLPDQDGFAVCRQLRPLFTNPILILTARNSDIDHVLGLELGADDYVVKPVEPRVLMARIQALLRRTRATLTPDKASLRFGRLHINVPARSVTLGQDYVALSSNEFELLTFLALHAGTIQSRAVLYRELYRREYDGIDRMLDVRISSLRRKLSDPAARRIKTVWGQGYLFVSDAW